MSDTKLDPLTDKLANHLNEYDEETKPALSDTLQTARLYVASAAEGYDVPEFVMNDCVIACAADLWQARDARNGIMSVSSDMIEPFRISSDPLRAVYPKLRAIGIPAGLGIA